MQQSWHVFKYITLQITSAADRRTDGQTDRIAICTASCGKKEQKNTKLTLEMYGNCRKSVKIGKLRYEVRCT